MGVSMNRYKLWITGALAACALASLPSVAAAEFAECGNIFLKADAKCEWREKEQCMTECRTETVEKACTAKVYTSCENQCTASASTSCTAGCSQSCTTSCTDPGPEPPSCIDLCTADCDKTCSDGRGRRNACCMHNCDKRCEKKCEGRDDPVAKPAECTQTCTNACSGSCTAQANIECQVSCQDSVYTECETETIRTCETKCEKDGGAIFCDGQFVNASSARNCADELKAKLDFDIDIKAEVSGVVDTAVDGTKDGYNTTKKKSKELCSVGLIGANREAGFGGLAAFGLCAGALTLLRSRRRR